MTHLVPSRHQVLRTAALALMASITFILFACGGAAPAGPASITLASVFDSAVIANTPAVPLPDPLQWDFGAAKGPGGSGEETLGANALHQVADLVVADGVLRGTTRGIHGVIHLPVPADVELRGALHAIEVRMRVSAGETMGVDFEGGPELDRDARIEQIEELDAGAKPTLSQPINDTSEMQTYRLDTAGTMIGSLPMGALRQLLLKPSDAAGAEFEIASVRLISRREHLSTVPSGVTWQGLGEVYRETLVTRTPESVSFDLHVPARAWLDLTVGTIQPGPATFIVSVHDGGSARELTRRTVTTADRWESVPIDLAEWAGRSITLRLAGAAEHDGTLLYWGGPVVRVRGDRSSTAEPTPARAALGSEAATPRHILVILADTLRRDRLPWYGGERDNAPVLGRLADEGMVFTHTVSQGTWTKVSVPSILTSLYPPSHGIVDIPDRLPASVTTLAEAVREAGYATYATSSVPFTGKLTNLHQGVETLHERGSIGELPHSGAKTARTYVDRLLPWLDEHAEAPFFVFLHVFDPHSPLEPYEPYSDLYTEPGEIEAHRERIKAVQEEIEDEHMRGDAMPTSAELEAAEVDAAAFVNTELDWYDASIRGMDAEIGRVLERLELLGIADDTLIVFLSDHGEEFLEHGRHFHGNTAYGEMLNVPLMLWWPGVIPAGRRDEIVESIDVYPTVLDLARIPLPEQVQGQSLVPLIASTEAPSRIGWITRPAFAQREAPPAETSGVDPDEEVSSIVMVADGWKLIKNTRRPEGWPEYELYDYANDPLDSTDVASEHADVVEELAPELDAWFERAVAARVEEVAGAELSAEEQARLRALGYIQ